jgi:glycosyltransferase involved in cell wall biosynthesis
METVVIIPCLNEAATIGKVVCDFRRQLPNVRVLVFDNNSTDDTRANALAAGAEVIPSPRRGKGAVLRQAFREIDAEYYVIVDGDDTYPAENVHELLNEVRRGADMATGDRLSGGDYSKENKRPLHNFGNKLICWSIQVLFANDIRDVLTGYRVMSRRFVKHCPILIDGFAVEAEMTIHAIERLLSIVEIPVAYRDRPAGSFSKLDTVSDGLTVLRSIVWLFKDAKPLLFFSLLALLQLLPTFLAIALFMSADPMMEFWLAATVVGFLTTSITFATGLTLDSVVRFQREQFEIRILESTRTKL